MVWDDERGVYAGFRSEEPFLFLGEKGDIAGYIPVCKTGRICGHYWPKRQWQVNAAKKCLSCFTAAKGRYSCLGQVLTGYIPV